MDPSAALGIYNPPPPVQFNFQFHAVLGDTGQNNRVDPHPWGWRITVWEILDPPLTIYIAMNRILEIVRFVCVESSAKINSFTPKQVLCNVLLTSDPAEDERHLNVLLIFWSLSTESVFIIN